MRVDPYIPDWACSQFGNWGHDWMDCFECVEAFEAQLDEEYERNQQASSIDPIDSLYTDYETIGG